MTLQFDDVTVKAIYTVFLSFWLTAFGERRSFNHGIAVPFICVLQLSNVVFVEVRMSRVEGISRVITLGGGGEYFRNFWVGMCRSDPGTLNLYQS